MRLRSLTRCGNLVETRVNPPAAGAAPAAGSMLKQRVLTAIALLALVLSCAFLLPGTGWQLLTSLLIALAAHEWSRLAGYQGSVRVLYIGVLVASCLAFTAALASTRHSAAAVEVSRLLFVAVLMFWAVAAPLWLYRGWRASHPLLLGAVGWLVLIPAWLGAAYLQRSPWVLLCVLLVMWTADIAAYFSGRSFGRRKLAPLISPGKTWEGVIGAFAAVLVYGLAASFVLQPFANAYDRAASMIFVACLAGLGIVGDLFESWMKRCAGAKDSGTLLPGHGGVLDRIDSLTAALPFAALYLMHYLPGLHST